MRLRGLPGRGDRRHACTSCGAGFPERNLLEAHWAGNGYCRANRFNVAPSSAGPPPPMPDHIRAKLEVHRGGRE